jgi:hypothetical protein
MLRPLLIRLFLLLAAGLLGAGESTAAVKTAAANGNWSAAGTWSPAGVPAAGDSAIVPSGKTVTMNSNSSIKGLNVLSGGAVVMNSNKTLTITGSLTVAGSYDMASGNITFSNGKPFTLSGSGTFIWNPGNNTAGSATLFTRGVENFSAGSTLIIKRWYDFSVPLGSIVASHFGNLVINTLQGSYLYEWDQKNWFATRRVLGTLTIDQAWVTLDRTGALNTTTIGNVVLLNANSWLDCHGGNHNGSFTVNITNLTANDGWFTGIYEGNGSPTINLSGNLSLGGNAVVVGIHNGIQTTRGIGNAAINIAGNLMHNSGQFYGLYTPGITNAGTATVSIGGNLVFSGGQFVLHYGCHTANGQSRLNVAGNTTINFSSSTDRFHLIGMSSQSATANNCRLSWNNSGDVSISGNSAAVFMTSASRGMEGDTVLGNLTISGGNNGFNWGIDTTYSHKLNIFLSQQLTVSGGATVFSHNNDTATIFQAGALNLTAGELTVTRNSPQLHYRLGGYNQSGGNLFIHKNTGRVSSRSVMLTCWGNFTQSGGTLTFDDNTTPTYSAHALFLHGATINLSGTGIIDRAGTGTSYGQGLLRYWKNGTMTHLRAGNNHTILNVTQTVSSNTRLSVAGGDLQISTCPVPSHELFRVHGGGVVDMGAYRIYADGPDSHSGLWLDNDATLITTRPEGLYDGTGDACLSSAKNLSFRLEPNSIIEYSGSDNQLITGTGVGTATGVQQEYGILRINFGGTPDAEYTYLAAPMNVVVRTRLELEAGAVHLNGNMLTVKSNQPAWFTRNSGYVRSETDSAVNTSRIRLQTVSPGTWSLPFGVTSTSYLPVDIEVLSGNGSLTVATRGTSQPDNLPWDAGVTNMAGSSGNDLSVIGVMDRWWKIQETGNITANVSLRYRGSENTVASDDAYGNFGVQSWNGSYWEPIAGSGTGQTTGVGVVTVTNKSEFGSWVVASNNHALPVELIGFSARLVEGRTELQWETATEINNDYFTIEHSTDGQEFRPIGTQPGAGNSNRVMRYSAIHDSPVRGYNYYRLKQTDFDGQYSYSPIETVKYQDGQTGTRTLEITSAGPNPFENEFKVNLLTHSTASIRVLLTTLSGNTVYESELEPKDGMNEFVYTAGSTLDAGTYLLHLVQGEIRQTRKLIKY